MKNIAIVGGAGFVGSHLSAELIKRGYKNLFIFDDLSTGIESNIPDGIFCSLVDISNPASLACLTDQFKTYEIDTVFFLAAKARVQPSILNPIEYNNTNVNGLLNVLEACRRVKLKGRFIYSSSSSVYGNVINESDFPLSETYQCNPMSPYGLQKYIGEQYCRLYSSLYNVECIILRYFNVFGHNNKTYDPSYSNAITIFAEHAKQNKSIPIINDGNQTRDFTYVGDIVSANILFGEMDDHKRLLCHAYNVCYGKPVRIYDIAKMFNAPIEYAGSKQEPKHNHGDNKHIQSLGWKPTVFVLDWIKKYYKL